ncbi:MAG: pilin [Gammaproteobacteria bacterium]|nr:pilin [Gammaproteobacteria bacterium]MDH5617686.1 pilin [Gammaproteobacteria bacterium]
MSRENDSESIYRAPASDTTFAPQGDLLAAYVGPKNADYYARRFDQIKRGGSSVSWHWPAFFISSWWLLYRKMWLYAFLYWIVLPFSLGIISGFAGAAVGAEVASGVYYVSYLLITFLLVPMFANRLYYRHAQKKADKVAAITSSAEQQAAELNRIGGTSNIVLVLLPIILAFLIGVIAAISVPAYNDYTIRAQVSEGLNLSSGAKAAVSEYYFDRQAFPADNEAAGLSPADRIAGKYTSSVRVANGTIVITYGNDAHVVINDATIVMEPAVDGSGSVVWVCSSPTILPKHLPAACR